jgi:outer membrane protein assembly factor BamB
VRVTCAAPCLRDGVLRVEATVREDRQLASVHATLDLDPARSVELAPAGQVYAAELKLEDWPFPAFERAVVATVMAVDGARNQHALEAPADQRPVVTRLRWAQAVDPGAAVALTSPAVRQDGVVVVAGNNGKVFFVTPDGAAAREPVSMAPAAITVPPAVSDDAVWVGTQSGGLFAINAAGAVTQATCSPAEPITGSLALSGSRVIASSQASVLIVADAKGFCDQTGTTGPVDAGVIVLGSGQVIASASGALYSYTLPLSGILRADWTGVAPAPAPPVIGDSISLSISADAEGSTWTIAESGGLSRTSSSAATTVVITIAGASSGPILLADGSAIVGSSAGLLERVSAGAAPPWSHSAQLNGAPAIALALRGAASTPALLVPTSTGRLYALSQDDGQVLWETRLSATGQALQPPNVSGAPGARTATAYVSGADGKLYAVVVDGQLDTTAPWPKAFHDPRNTSNAGTQP